MDNPNYGIEIIVLVKYKNEYSWYLGDKDYWILDYIKWIQQFESLNIHNYNIVNERNNYWILNKDNWMGYSKSIKNQLITKGQLTEMIFNNLPIKSWDEKGELFPSLFIDFDDCVLISLFPEYTRFENFVPNNWIGKYDDFYSLIPSSEKYWIINDIDYFPKA